MATVPHLAPGGNPPAVPGASAPVVRLFVVHDASGLVVRASFPAGNVPDGVAAWDRENAPRPSFDTAAVWVYVTVPPGGLAKLAAFADWCLERGYAIDAPAGLLRRLGLTPAA